MAVSVVRDPSFRQHLPSPSHPESPGRLRAIDRALDASALTLVEREARPATRDELLRAHDAALVDAVERSRGVPTIFDADTRTSAVSVDAALRAAGAAIDLATQVTPGEAPPGIALVRPPGHHATRDRVMGFCLFNNVAVAARALQAAGLAERVAIFATAPGWFARTRSRRRQGRSRWVRPSRGRGVRSDFGHPAKSGRITHEA
jgi:acetoin utilization deacetylase AcuC-like enzyme